MVGAGGGRRERGQGEWGTGRRERTGWVVQEEGTGDMVDGAREGERGQGNWGKGREEETGGMRQGKGGGKSHCGPRGGSRPLFTFLMVNK